MACPGFSMFFVSFLVCPNAMGGGATPPPTPPPAFFLILRTFHDLFIDRSICLPIKLSICLPICLAIYHPPTHQPTDRPTYPPTYLSTYLPIYLSIYLSFCHSSVLAFLMLPPSSSIQNALSTFFFVFFWNPCFHFAFYWNLYFLFTFPLKFHHYFLFTSLLKSLLSLNFSIEIPTIFVLVCWISYFLSPWNPYFFRTFPLKSLPSLHFSIEILTFSVLFYWNLSFPSTFLMKFLLSLHFSVEISRKHVANQIKQLPKLKRTYSPNNFKPIPIWPHHGSVGTASCGFRWFREFWRIIKYHRIPWSQPQMERWRYAVQYDVSFLAGTQVFRHRS